MDLYDAYGCRITQRVHCEQQEKHPDSAEDQTTSNAEEPPQRAISNDAAICAQGNQSESYEEKNYRLQRRGLVVQILLCVFTALAFGAAAYYAKVANRQLGIMRQQLETTDRPWIQIIGASVTDGLALYRRVDNRSLEGSVSVKLVVKNVGRSVAINVKMTGRLMFELVGDLLREEQRNVCLSQDYLHTTRDFTLFPNQDSGDILTGQIGTGGHETIPFDQVLPTFGGALMTNPLFTGCITYKFSGSATPHHTGFLYRFAVKYSNGIARPDRTFMIGERIPGDRLALAEDPGGFSAVD